MNLPLKGGPELLKFLDEFPEKMVKNIMRGAMRAGANVVREEARLNVARQSGALSRSIKSSVNSRSGTITAKVKLKGKHSFLGPMLEYGVRAHIISLAEDKRPMKMTRHGLRGLSLRTINKAVARGSLVINGTFVGDAVMHPGFAAKPFLRPALDRKAEDAVNAVGKYIAGRLNMGDLRAPVLTAVEDDE